MGFTSYITVVAFLGFIAACVVKKVLPSRGNGLPLPPGPKGMLLLGNINDMPKPGVLEAFHWLKHKDLYDTGFLSANMTLAHR
jgi:hypothetical protein